MATSKLDLVERTSFLSGGSKHHGEYIDAKTPHNDIEGGALRAGGAPNLLSKESFGLLAQYAAVGLIYGALPATVTPFLKYYLGMQSTQVTSARTLLNIPWSFKVFIGMISDCFPIFGFRRRPYMVIGWSVCCLMLLIMGFMPLEAPYFPDPKYREMKPDEISAEMKATFNENAPNVGGTYTVLMMFACLGYLIADVAADAVVVEYAQREPEEIRGRTQTAIYSTRTFFGTFSLLFMAFGMNGPEYGGDFEFGMSFSTLMLVLGFFCLPIVPITWLFIRENKHDPANLKEYMNILWEFIQSRAAYQVIAYCFFSGIFANFTYVAYDAVTEYWVLATPLSLNLSAIFGNFVFIGALGLVGKYGLSWNWRHMIAITAFATVAIDSFCTMFTTWDILRNQWFWVGVPIVENVPMGISFIISTFIVVELAGENNEGAIYGLLTTVMNLSDPFAKTLSKNVNAPFLVDNDSIQSDTTAARRDVTITILIAYAMKIFSLVFLPLLPPQKAEAQELKRKGGSSKLLGGLTIFYLLFALIWSVTTNLLSIFPSTSCLVIAGGGGCDVPSSE
jgi:hypothetical protein